VRRANSCNRRRALADNPDVKVLAPLHTRLVRGHVAVVHPRYVSLVLAGQKTMESRLSIARCQPWGCVGSGDELYFKCSGGTIKARARVTHVESRSELTPVAIATLRAQHNATILATSAYWRDRRRARYATLITFADVMPIDVGPAVRLPRLYGRGWIVLGPQALGKSRRRLSQSA
jgi:hypothetical protein